MILIYKRTLTCCYKAPGAIVQTHIKVFIVMFWKVKIQDVGVPE